MYDFERARCGKVHPTLKENAMDTNTLLLLVIVLLLLGGGYYGRKRWF
ncbi:MAG: LPXTG cell wall anchor domain-containing protein [Rhodomicrobium sp.]